MSINRLGAIVAFSFCLVTPLAELWSHSGLFELQQGDSSNQDGARR